MSVIDLARSIIANMETLIDCAERGWLDRASTQAALSCAVSQFRLLKRLLKEAK